MLKRFGTEYGGFFYPEKLDNLNENSIIYCVGAGEDISHDIIIAKQLNSKVYIFDPTPRSIQHIQYIKDIFDNKSDIIHNSRYGGGNKDYLNILLNNKIDSKKIFFYDYGLYIKDTELKFYKPDNPEYVSHSLIKSMKSDDYIMVKVKKLKTIMQELNHTKIDLLKIDIEGCECDVLEQMIQDNIFPLYLSVDFDLARTNNNDNIQRCNNIIKLLINNGYKLLKNLNYDCSFQYIKY